MNSKLKKKLTANSILRGQGYVKGNLRPEHDFGAPFSAVTYVDAVGAH